MFEYNEEYYNTNDAKEIVPFLNEIFYPETIIDVGCGRGTWLQIFSQLPNVKEITGIDEEYADKSTSYPKRKFCKCRSE